MPSDRIGQKAKCGACGRYITGIGSGSDSCPLCGSSVSTGVPLSNGQIVHELCLKNLQDRKEKIESEVSEKQLKISRVQREIEQRRGIAFKLMVGLIIK